MRKKLNPQNFPKVYPFFPNVREKSKSILANSFYFVYKMSCMTGSLCRESILSPQITMFFFQHILLNFAGLRA